MKDYIPFITLVVLIITVIVQAYTILGCYKP